MAVPYPPPWQDIDRNTPLRLSDAVRAAFPHGGVTVSALRREAAKGRLIINKRDGFYWIEAGCPL